MTYVFQTVGSNDEPRLRDEHAYLDRLFQELIQHAEAAEWEECEERADLFAREMEQHMRYEENLLFPAYAKTSPAATEWTRRLCAEHADLRRRLELLRDDIKQRSLRSERCSYFVNRLREVGDREGDILYPWLASLAVPEPALSASWQPSPPSPRAAVLL